MKIDVYADVVCPWCYVGERNATGAVPSTIGLLLFC